MRFAHNSTISVKKKRCVSCGNESYIFSKGMCEQCARVHNVQKQLSKEGDRIIDNEKLGDIIADADNIFSQYIRLKYADDNGYVSCFICGSTKHWTMMQCGHYIKRGILYLRFDERNCRPNCQHCNEHLNGNLSLYTEKLELECHGVTDILKAEMAIVHKPNKSELREIISEYAPKVKLLKSKVSPKS